MYYIYEIPGVKIGCTSLDDMSRPRSQSHDFRIIEQHEDIMVASQRELELQKELGYPVDSHPYYEVIKRSSRGAKSQLEKGTHNFQIMPKEKRKEISSLGASAQPREAKVRGGLANKGIPKPHAKEMARALNIEWTCLHCNKSGKGAGNFSRYGHKQGTCKPTHGT